MSTNIYEFFHYSLFPGLFLAFTYNKKEPPVFGAAPAFWCILLSFLGLSFRHISNNLSNYNVLTANAPFFYQISGTWSNHEGSILLWCRIVSFYGFLFCYRARPQSHNVSKRGGHRSSLFSVFVSNFVNHSILKGKIVNTYEKKHFIVKAKFFNSSADALTSYSHSSNYLKKSSANYHTSKRARRILRYGLREGKRTHPFLHLARDDKERASSIDEQRSDGALGIALFFSPFLSASSDPFVRNFFVRTEPLAESNPVPQDPISAIHPPCIYAGEVASALGFGLCRSKILHGIVALNSPPFQNHFQKNFVEGASQNYSLFRLNFKRCVGSPITNELFPLQCKDVGAKGYPALFLRSNISLKMRLRSLKKTRTFKELWFLPNIYALVDTGRDLKYISQPPFFPLLLHFFRFFLKSTPKYSKETTIFGRLSLTLGKPLSCFYTYGANTVVSDQDQEAIRIWILTCRSFLTVGILPGSWWAHHELGRGGWWFRDPVENASFMPRVLATACIHSYMRPLMNSWTYFLNIVTLPCCVSGTSSIRSGLLAPVHAFATDDTRGRLLWWFFLLMTGISILLFSQMKQQAFVRRTYQKEMVVAISPLVHPSSTYLSKTQRFPRIFENN